MAAVSKIDSNGTGLRYAEEASPKVLPGSPIWKPVEPNSYESFGGEVTTIARNPINPSRQRKKGVVTDLDASGGFNMDLTQENAQDLLQGFFFASLRTKGELPVPTVTSTTTYTPASGGATYKAGDLLWAKGFAAAANNGLKTVNGTPSATAITVAETLSAATTQTGTISKVGHQFASGDVSINSGAKPTLVSAAFDLTTLGLIPGEWIYIGGDQTAEKFATAADNGFARVRSVTTTTITFDKTAGTVVTDAGTGKTIRIFFGRLLKNETGSNIVRRTYQFERTLGAPDSALPSQIQAEYLLGAVANEITLNVGTADKVTVDMGFIGMDNEQVTGATGVKSGTRPSIVEADAFNTSSDFSRIKMSLVDETSSNVTPLFAFLTEMNLTINNNVSPNKAVGVLGAFDMTAGTFEVGGSVTAYFADVTAISAIRNNSSVTLDAHLVKNNKGISIDIPLIDLSDGRPNIEQDQPITLPLSLAAADASYIDPTIGHTALICFYDYLPTAAS